MYSYSGANLDYKSLSRQFWRILLTCSILLFILAFVSVVVAIVQLAKNQMGEREKDHYYQALPTLLTMFSVSLLGIIAIYLENNGLLLRHVIKNASSKFYCSSKYLLPLHKT